MDRDGRARQAEQTITQLPTVSLQGIAGQSPAAAHCQASIPASNSSRCRLMRIELGLERAGKLLTKVAAVFYDLVSAHICSGVLANSVFRRPPSPRATAALMVRTTMSQVSHAESNSISPFGWTRKPAGSSLFCFDICIFSPERVHFFCRESRSNR